MKRGAFRIFTLRLLQTLGYKELMDRMWRKSRTRRKLREDGNEGVVVIVLFHM